MKLLNLIKKNLTPLIFILIISFFFRLYKAQEFFIYSHDQDLLSWFVKSVVFDKNLRLIGQETSTAGIFIGPLWYYLSIPFYLLLSFDPIGAFFFSVLVGVSTTCSIYFVFSKIVDKKAGIIGAFIHATSYLFSLSERETVPTVPFSLWSVWFLYALYLLLSKKQSKFAFVLVGALIALTWHINLSLALLMPLVLIALFFSQRKVHFNDIVLVAIPIIILASPFFLYEARNSFLQTRSFISSFSSDQYGDIYHGFEKVQRVFYLVSKNLNSLFAPVNYIKPEYYFFAFSVLFCYLLFKKHIKAPLGALIFLWFTFVFAFFALYSKPVSEYYLNSLLVLFLFVLTVFISKLKLPFSLAFLTILSVISVYRFINHPLSNNGYIQKTAIVKEISSHSKTAGSRCISVSYITNPGYNLGYRYLLFMNNLKVNTKENNPVYSIVFPLSLVDKVDKTFGTIGLIYPETNKEYNLDCSINENISLPLWGLP